MSYINKERLCEDLMSRWEIADKEKEKEIQSIMADVVVPIVVGQPSADVAEVVRCKDCEEIIEWHEIKTRKPTDEEKHAFALDMIDVPYVFICAMPEDGEDILIQTPWGISSDVCEYDCDYGYGLEERGDWDDVIAWAKMPKGIRERKDNG